MVEQKLTIRQTQDHTLFYINGELQFSSRDEHIYHEILVHPGSAILDRRVSFPWRALILGGGDGLALREILKYPRCAAIDLVDHDPDVLSHARTTFSKLNHHAFDNPKVSTFIEDVECYLTRSDIFYDLIISDLIFPSTPETARLFTWDFFMRIRERLSQHGIFSMNAVSPTQHDQAYQAIFNTLTALNLHPCPLQFLIPSFVDHGYGPWGFFFGSPRMISPMEWKPWKSLVKTRFLQTQQSYESLINSFTSTSSFYQERASKGEVTIIRTPLDMLNLLNIPMPLNISPAQIDSDWVIRVLNILRCMDIEQLFEEVHRRIQLLSASLQEQFQFLRRALPILLKENILNIEHAKQVVSVLMLIIISVNLLCPDNIYAKGTFSSNSSEGIPLFSGNNQPTLFHSKVLQTETLDHIIDMQGKDFGERSSVADLDLAKEELFYAIMDDIFLTPSGKVFFKPERLAPYYYRMKPESFTLMCHSCSVPLLFLMPDNETVYQLLNNLSIQIKAIEKTMTDYQKWNQWISPMSYVSKKARKESLEIANLDKIHSALRAAWSEFMHYHPVKPEPDLYLLAPGIYQRKGQTILLWLAENKWAVAYSYRGESVKNDFPVYQTNEETDALIQKALDNAKLKPPVQEDVFMAIQKILKEQFIEMEK